MPLVTVLASPTGAPMATTGWPTLTPLEVPNEIVGYELCPLTLITARSVLGSRPTRVAGAVAPSLNTTWMEPPLAAAAMT
jgi:hypothetical protein